MQQRAVTTGESNDSVIKFLQPPPLLPVGVTQKNRSQHRRQGERVEGRNGDGKCDGQRKLAKQNASRSRKEGNGYEYGNQHKRSCDDGAGDLAGGCRCCFVGIVFAFCDMALNVFNHDDRVVNHQSDGECDAEQGECVDGEAEQLHKNESADQRNRSGDEVNHRRPPVAEKDEDDHDD